MRPDTPCLANFQSRFAASDGDPGKLRPSSSLRRLVASLRVVKTPSMIRRSTPFLCVILVGAAQFQLGAAALDAPDFTRDVRPLLSRNCFKCHGPDDAREVRRVQGRRAQAERSDAPHNHNEEQDAVPAHGWILH